MLHSDLSWLHTMVQMGESCGTDIPGFLQDPAVQSCQHPAVQTQHLAAVRWRKGAGGSQHSQGSHLGRCCLQEERDVLQQLQLLKLLPSKSP